MRRKTKSILTWIILLAIAVGIIVAYFILSSRKNEANYEAEKEVTEVTRLLDKNLDTAYPATPREVVKLYSRIMKCLYDHPIEAKQLAALTDQLRLLFDEELLGANPREQHIELLQAEIAEYAAAKRTVMSYQVESANNVVLWEYEQNEYARLVASYTEKEELSYLKVFEEFVLRKNDKGRWKIVGWKLTDKIDID